MRLLARGIPIVFGFSIGRVKFFKKDDILSSYINRNCIINNIDIELDRLKRSFEIFRGKIKSISDVEKETKELLNAHELIAEAIVHEAENLIKERSLCAEVALALVADKYIRELKESGSGLISLRVDDLIDIASQLINILINKPAVYDIFLTNTEKIILVTEYILPSEVIVFRKRGLAGLITKRGGVTAHSAILARTFNIPYVLLPELNDKIINEISDKLLLINGYDGSIILLENYEEIAITDKIAKVAQELSIKFYEERYERPITIDGKYINIFANIGNIDESRTVLEYGGEGIGLLRLEFIYMNRERAPSEEELYNVLRKISEYLGGREVIVRALDAGGDKPISYLGVLKEDNPFLGLRGIRLLLKEHEEILIDEIKAVLRASALGRFGFMVPMISTIDEILSIKKLIKEIKEDFEKNNIKYGYFQFGIMVEVPSIALVIDRAIKLVDFISIGTNDLTQYTLAVDRGNEKVQYLYNDMHPSVLRLIHNVTRIAKIHNVRVDVCGELASNELATPILLALGVDTLSMNPISIPKIKYIIRKLNVSSIYNRVINALYNFDSEDDIKTVALDILINSVPELKYLTKIYANYTHP
ncbi:phosphoenolpyruvate--protein phosphotransferase [Pyrobaculum sp.]|uniref:phosphoenolpyruvate--protein phosphotransferase n=1 Tax=Pyrobaculum sp. TaxID=2004705 RepID=UPI003175E0C6